MSPYLPAIRGSRLYIDITIITVYFVVMLTVGWLSRKQSVESYWVAERRYGPLRITASMIATIFGASSTIGIIGLGYSRGLTGAWWLLVGAGALIPFGLFLAARVRSLDVYTLPDILKNAYGNRVAVPAGLMISIAWCGVLAAQMVAAGRLLETIFNIDFSYALTVAAAVFILYTFWGGQLSVIRTDLWQLILFIGGLILCVILLFKFNAADPFIWSNIPADNLRFPVNESFGWYDLLVYYPLIVGLPYLVGPDIYSRVLCARDNMTVRIASITAAAVMIPLAIMLVAAGILARAAFPGIAPESALPETFAVVIPAGLRGLIAAGFLGGIMSSADTVLLSASTIFTVNVIKPLFHLPERSYLGATKIFLLIFGIGGFTIAWYEQGIISSLLIGYTVFVGGVVFPTLAALFKSKLKVSSSAALWAVIIGGGTAVMGKLADGCIMKTILTSSGSQMLQSILGPQYLSLLPLILSLLVLITLSVIMKKS